MGILSSEVVDAVGDVAGLLYLSQEVAGTDGMQTACWQEKEVAVMSLVEWLSRLAWGNGNSMANHRGQFRERGH